ncbi:unnamed protein product [Adineta steineri]|uniref:Uncharacterized protein n=1 Tax=Adineta steineri TaxID=433720 RepID=A0A815SHH5_9BILA|nr:unnamed protein product [Adineta steineri]CAF4052330.1 unnamed protein product [Adineta steineri]
MKQINSLAMVKDTGLECIVPEYLKIKKEEEECSCEVFQQQTQQNIERLQRHIHDNAWLWSNQAEKTDRLHERVETVEGQWMILDNQMFGAFMEERALAKQFVLPFSRRLVYINRLLSPKSSEQLPAPGSDHIFQDVCEDDVDDQENGNVEFDDEKKEKTIEIVEEEDDDDDDDENGTNMQLEVSSSSSTTSEYFDMDNTNDDTDDDTWFDTISSNPPSPFAVDPYESFDYEC